MFKSIFKAQEPAAKAPESRPRATELDGNALFEALVCEFHWTALQIGAVCQVFNNAIAKSEPWKLRACWNVFPVEAAVVNAALTNRTEIALSAELTTALRKIYFNLADARSKTENVLEKIGSITPVSLQSLQLDQLGAMWRQIAADSMSAIQDLEPETRWRLAGVYTENALILGKFLKEAKSGQHSCVDQLGNVALPPLPQRRREPRFSLLQPCKIYVRNGAHAGFARDISRNGMGISCPAELRLRENVIIEVCGRRFKGRVVWSKKEMQGIQLDTPLAPTDPLIAS